MSTNSNCNFYDVGGKWFYLLEDQDAPKNAWDWREHSRAYGPFTSEEAADQHLSDNHANPGGTQTIGAVDLATDDVLRRAIEAAISPRASQRSFRPRLRG